MGKLTGRRGRWGAPPPDPSAWTAPDRCVLSLSSATSVTTKGAPRRRRPPATIEQAERASRCGGRRSSGGDGGLGGLDGGFVGWAALQQQAISEPKFVHARSLSGWAFFFPRIILLKCSKFACTLRKDYMVFFPYFCHKVFCTYFCT